MNNFDEYIKHKLSEDDTELPNSVKSKIEETLAKLPEKETPIKQIRTFNRIAAAAACFIFVTLFLLPNMSAAYAQDLEQIPVIGDIVRVITIRNYFYSDAKHEMNINIPKIENENSELFVPINADVKELSEALVQQFYDDLEYIGDEGHSSIYVDYETITNTDTWFTLKLLVHEAAGSGNTYYKYYHLNKITGKTVNLGDIAAGADFYNIVEQEIITQMTDAMEKDSKLIYWTEANDFGDDFVSLTPEHNFYWNEDYNLVIPFDKYEVAPGYMGTPEFVIDRELIKDAMKPISPGKSLSEQPDS